RGDGLARHDLLRKDLQLLDQDGGLYRVEPSVDADAHVVVLVRALAVNAQAADRTGERLVVGEHRAAVAVAAERLRRKEAGGRGRADRPDTAVLVDGAEALRRVREQPQAMLRAERLDSVVVRRLAEEIDADDAN